ncbi:MAG: hypothetical protein ACRDF4_01660 [Rhabdochlamydiaceae bacterium]
MAIEVDLGASYDFFYSRYSGKVHNVDLTKDAITHDLEKDVLIGTPLRYVKEGKESSSAMEIVAVSAKLAKIAFEKYAEHFIPARTVDVLQWWDEYKKESSTLASSKQR